jgi:hypothetical protein
MIQTLPICVVNSKENLYRLRELCSDEFSLIFEYLDYVDYSNIYNSNDFLRSMIQETTHYVDIVNSFEDEKIDLDDYVRLFYHLLNKGLTDIAIKIYQTHPFDIFILYDVFKQKMCSPTLKNIRNLIEISGEKWTDYSFLSSEEEYSNVLDLIKRISLEIEQLELDFYLEHDEYNLYLENHIEYFTYQCKDQNIGFEQIIITFALGINKMLQIYAGFIYCCSLGKIEAAKFLERYVVGRDDIVALALRESIYNGHKELFYWLCGQERTNKILLSKLFIDCCERNLIIPAMYIYEVFDINSDNELLEETMRVCCSSSLDYSENVTWLKSLIVLDEEKANKYFELACDSNRVVAIGLFHTTGFITPKVVRRCIFKSIKLNNLDTFKFLITFAELGDKTSMIIGFLKYSCCYGHSGFVEFLLNRFQYNKKTLHTCLSMCATFGRYNSARELIYNSDFEIEGEKERRRILYLIKRSKNFSFYLWFYGL